MTAPVGTASGAPRPGQPETAPPASRPGQPQTAPGAPTDPGRSGPLLPPGGLLAGPRGEGATPLTLGVTAGLVGGYRWIEQALCELLGGWVTDIALPAVQVHLDAQAARHAWHAELWGDRLPVLAGVDPDGLTRPPEPALGVLSALAGAVALPPVGTSGRSWPPLERDGAGSGPAALPRLAGLYRVVIPRLVVSYGIHLRATSWVADQAVARTLRLVLADEIEDWQVGEQLVQRLVTRPHDVDAVGTFVRELETVVVAAPLSSGLVRFPDGFDGL